MVRLVVELTHYHKMQITQCLRELLNLAINRVGVGKVAPSAVLEAGVIGMPDPVYGEKVIAFIALRQLT